ATRLPTSQAAGIPGRPQYSAAATRQATIPTKKTLGLDRPPTSDDSRRMPRPAAATMSDASIPVITPLRMRAPARRISSRRAATCSSVAGWVITLLAGVILESVAQGESGAVQARLHGPDRQAQPGGDVRVVQVLVVVEREELPLVLRQALH